MKHHRWFRLLAVLSVVALIAAACGDDDDGDDEGAGDTTTTEADGGAGSDEPLVIGALLPDTGALSAIVQSLRVPIEMAVEEINAAGGVLDADVTIANADDGTDPNVASASFDTLVESDGAQVILGPASSTTMLGIFDKVTSSDVTVCSGSNTAAELTDIEDDGRYFRTTPTDNFQGPALAELILGDGHTQVGIIVRNDAYGTGFADAIAEALENGGAEVVANVAYDPNAPTFDADVDEVVAGNPEAVVVIGFNDDGGKVISTMIQKGVGPADVPIYTADGMQSSAFKDAVDANNPGAISGIKGTAPAASPSGVDHPFQAAFAERGVDPIFSSYYYDCTIIMALAAVAAGSTAPDDIAAEVVGITRDGEKCNTFADCLALLEEGEDIDYDGASGPIDMVDVGEPPYGAYEIWEYDAEGAVSGLDVPQIRIEA